MEELSWWLTQSAPGGALLLVAVDAVPQGAGAYPCRVVGAVSALTQPAAQPIPPVPPETRIRELLSAVGVPANLLGFTYLLTALTLMQQEPSLRRNMTRALYPRIARQHDTEARSVERAIRHAIAATWARSGGDPYRHQLGRLASFVGEKPTNSEFLAQVSECLRRGNEKAI